MSERYGRSPVEVDRWLSCVLALRLRQIEQTFPTYGEFADKSGVSRSTLQHLRMGRGNATLKTLSVLAEAFDISVMSLLSVPDDTIKQNIESFGLPYDDIVAVVDQFSDQRTIRLLVRPRGRSSLRSGTLSTLSARPIGLGSTRSAHRAADRRLGPSSHDPSGEERDKPSPRVPGHFPVASVPSAVPFFGWRLKSSTTSSVV